MASTKKKIGGALGGVAVVGAAIALTAGTFSYFSDSTTTQPQQVTAGTLTLTVGDSGSTPVALGNVEPGYVGPTNTLTYQNTGSLSGRLRIRIKPNAGNSAVFNKYVQVDVEGTNDSALNGTNSLAKAYQISKNGSFVHDEGPGNIKSFPITVKVDPNAGNALQGKTGGFTVQADLVQINNSGVVGNPGFQAPPAQPAP